MKTDKTNTYKHIYMFTKGADKKLRDVMVYTYDSLIDDYDRLLAINYKGVGNKNYAKDAIGLFISLSIFYRIILKPLYSGTSFVERMQSRFNVDVKIGKKGQVKIDIDEVDKLQKTFYAILKKYGIHERMLEFEEMTDMIKVLVGPQEEAL